MTYNVFGGTLNPAQSNLSTHFSATNIPTPSSFSSPPIQNSSYLWPLAPYNLQPLPFHCVSSMHATSTFLSDNSCTTLPDLPVSESTFRVPTRNCQPFRSPSALRSSFTQPCALAQGYGAFQLGFPTSCLRSHVGAPTG